MIFLTASIDPAPDRPLRPPAGWAPQPCGQELEEFGRELARRYGRLGKGPRIRLVSSKRSARLAGWVTSLSANSVRRRSGEEALKRGRVGPVEAETNEIE